ncbi:MAG: methyltransferase domain-containing protein [Planctomycetota bacterium]|jgi:trans-aconitate methyltransferase
MMRKELMCLALVLSAAAAGYADLTDLVRSSAVKGGLVVHIGCGDGKDTAALRLNDRYMVQGLEVSEAKVQEAKQNIRTAGRYGKISVRQVGTARFPFTNSTAGICHTWTTWLI